MTDSEIINSEMTVARLSELCSQLDRAYDSYAKSVGLTYTGLYMLELISGSKNCTQKYLCEQMFLPKQTANSIIKSFQAQGLLEMTASPEDKRCKVIRFTDKGKAYANSILPKITAAENCCMEQFSTEEQQQFLDLMTRYARTFSAELTGDHFKRSIL